MTIQTDKTRYSKHIVKAATKRVRFQGQELYLVAEESFEETEMILATSEQANRSGVDVASPPELTFAAVVGADVWRDGQIIGSRSDIEDI